MVANKQALVHLPAGASTSSLTYDQLLTWGQALKSATGRRVPGWPAGPDGLIKRFFEGYAYPSFTGGLNTTFSSSGAAGMWQWFKQTWAVSNPQPSTYSFMQEARTSRVAGGRQPGAVPADVRVIEPLGSQTLVTVTISGTEFKLLTAAGFTAGVNSVLWLRPLPDKIRWFRADGSRLMPAD